MVALGWLVLTYLLAAVPFGIVVTTWMGATSDLRASGSGNIGATNVARVAGWRAAGLVLAADAAKGFVPTVLARWFWPFDAAFVDVWVAVVAVTAFVGHCWSVYLEFRGGKGVATATGALLAIAPAPVGIAIAVWVAVFAATRRSSLSALVAAPALVAAALWLDRSVVPVAAVLAVGIAARHVSNVRRLMRGEEAPVVGAGPKAETAADLLGAGPAGAPAPPAWRDEG